MFVILLYVYFQYYLNLLLGERKRERRERERVRERVGYRILMEEVKPSLKWDFCN